MRLDIKNFYAWPLSTRLLMMVIVCAAVFYLMYTWDINDVKTQLQTQETKENTLKQQLEDIVTKEVAVTQALTQYEGLKKLLTEWQQKLITYPDLPELLNTILKIGGSDHIYFTQFTPGQEIEENHYIKVPIRIIAVGSYHQLADFISQIANLPNIVVIGDFSVAREAKNDVIGAKLAEIAVAQNLLTADITFNVYRLPRPGELKVEDKKKDKDKDKDKAAKDAAKGAKTPPTKST